MVTVCVRGSAQHAVQAGRGVERAAVVDGVRRSLQTGFVYTSHDLSEDLLDQAYGMLADLVAMDQVAALSNATMILEIAP